ncbi:MULTISPECIES: DUF4097 family beta strand repeat-containing protein [Actinokineospora]|uniref:DUF4097 domain-containing protein n=1 Tax=Actinokineospora fastidiosa TaxID=1816 RepID=A0A918G869_9PSEU|nr:MULTISPECIES: DUF4097 family beta strand repeat-containing protein [Actinokineospora]UVS82508.1 hypothetical protein Actkin_06281 [Actinokineospora sp. UTMC 2448]GGS20607.1 hypothetical protein GCM10010171_11580 [Actinokineospora fastidiosa]
MRVLAGITAAGLAATLATGCGLATREFSESADLGPGVTTVRLAQDAGDVTIRVGATSSVRRTVHYLDEKPGATHRVEGDALILEGCGQNNCWIDYEVVVPQGYRLAGDVASGDVTVEEAESVDLRSSSGDVTVRGVSGAASVEANSGRVDLSDVGENASVLVQSGDVDLRGVAGDASVRSSSGTVTVTGVGGAVDVEATSGDVAIGVAEPVDVRAHATSGRVDVTVPRGRYRVSVEVGSGDIDCDVQHDAAATTAIDLSTSSGDVTVRYA